MLPTRPPTHPPIHIPVRAPFRPEARVVRSAAHRNMRRRRITRPKPPRNPPPAAPPGRALEVRPRRVRGGPSEAAPRVRTVGDKGLRYMREHTPEKNIEFAFCWIVLCFILEPKQIPYCFQVVSPTMTGTVDKSMIQLVQHYDQRSSPPMVNPLHL